MFRIGQFAQIAQVSSRQLRFYDQLGLLAPARIDERTGYRYYSVRQLPRLNRILALQELGFSLEQIGPMVNEGVTATDLLSMLQTKRAQVEQSMREEAQRLAHIESRIALLDGDEGLEGIDVVTKSVDSIPFASVRDSYATMEQVLAMVRSVAFDGAKRIDDDLRDRLIAVARNDGDRDDFDIEIGYSLTRLPAEAVIAGGGIGLRVSQLPPVETMATLVRAGTDAASHHAFGSLGRWIEANGYAITGPCRELFLESILEPPGLEGALVEIQFPVARAA
ncbi:MAG TPA: MerR family transcriptional regulator [Candidatus Elarobacter sp.]|jgi:DNA-binding transcriptional MerR regulator